MKHLLSVLLLTAFVTACTLTPTQQRAVDNQLPSIKLEVGTQVIDSIKGVLNEPKRN